MQIGGKQLIFIILHSTRDNRNKDRDRDRNRDRRDRDRNRGKSEVAKPRTLRSKTRTDTNIKTRAESQKVREDRSKTRPLELDRRGERGRRDDQSKRREKSKRPRGAMAKAIGKRLENSRYDYIDNLRHIAGDDIDYVLTDIQVFQMFENARLRLHSDEKEDFIRDMEDKRFTVEDFLLKCHLDIGAFSKDSSYNTKIIISNDEKEKVTKLLAEIGQAMKDQNKEFERIFNIGPYDDKVEFNEFKYGIENDLGHDIARIANDPRLMSLLRHYLLYDSENDDKIRTRFLKSSLFPRSDDQPEVKTRMNCITDFIEFLQKTPSFDFEKELRGDISHEEFEKILDSNNYIISRDNMHKLKDAFTSPEEPTQISLNLIKRNINLLAPEFLNANVKADRKEIVDRLTHVDPKVKKWLQKISAHLKKQRIDTMTFFEQCDENGDGVITQDEFSKCVTHWEISGLKDKQAREIYKVIDNNDNDALTIGEIWLYIEGAQPTIAERGAIIGKELEKDMEDQITAMFNEFKQEDKTVTKESVRRILTAFSVPSSVITKTLQN